MLEKFKRDLIKRKLKKEKVKILGALIEVNRKLKMLDEMDEKEKKEKDKEDK